MTFSRIIGLGAKLPERALSNDDLREFVDTSDDWIRARTGIASRRIAADGELAGDLALPAARDAMAQAGVDGADLDLIVFATTTPDRIYPASACLLQAKLSAAPCAAFDVQAVCSGFLYALGIADAMIRAGSASRALVVGADVYSHILDWTDRGTCVLFGDGAGAAVLESAEAPGVLGCKLRADGTHADRLTVPAHLERGKIVGDPFTRMHGASVYRFAVEKMTSACNEVLSGAQVGADAVDHFIPHQANSRIIGATRERLGIAEDKTVMTVAEHGNTSAASIPLALASAAERFRNGDNILMAAVGGGFTWGAALVRWNADTESKTKSKTESKMESFPAKAGTRSESGSKQ